MRKIGSADGATLTAGQRVNEAALAFNLLAIESTWRPMVAAAFPYRSRDWVAWCDKYLRELEHFEKTAPDFQIERSLRQAGSDLRRIRDAFATSAKAPMPAVKQGGCYVATSVYGDYEAPQVLVLRRWRDSTLTTSPLGRALVQAYYATSPSLVRVVGSREWFRVPVRSLLDRLVSRLERRQHLDGLHKH